MATPVRLVGLASAVRRGGRLIPCCQPSLAGPSTPRPSSSARSLHASRRVQGVAAVSRAEPAVVPETGDWFGSPDLHESEVDAAPEDFEELLADASSWSAELQDSPPDYLPFNDGLVDSLARLEALEEELVTPAAYSPTPHVGHRVSKAPLAIDTPPDDDTYSMAYWRRRKIGTKSKRHRRHPAPLKVLEQGDKFYEELIAYKRHFEPLMEAVHLEEVKSWATRLREWSSERLTREGYALMNLAGDWTGVEKKGQRHIATFNRVGKNATQDFDWNRLEPGTTIVISRSHPLLDPIASTGEQIQNETMPEDGPLGIEREDLLLGVVRKRIRGKIQVAFDTRFDLTGKDNLNWRLDLAPNDVVHRRTMAAIQSLHLNPLEQAVQRPDGYELSGDAHHEPSYGYMNEQTILNGTALRDILFRSFQPSDPQEAKQALAGSGRASPTDVLPGDVDATPVPPVSRLERGKGAFYQNPRITSWAERYRLPNPTRRRYDPPLELNPSQMKAIALMLGERMCLIQGPPGTGKTRTIIEAIKLLKQHWKVPHPILVTAFTNVAVDNLVDGLTKHGLNAVRVGDASVVREDLLPYTLEHRKTVHPTATQIEIIKEKINEERREIELSPKSAQEKDSLHDDLQRRWRSTYRLEQEMNTAILRDADVVCTTCISSVNRDLQAIDFPVVFLDEASMATEPGSLIPLTKGACHVAIIGDHKQLPPVITSDVAQAGGLATSLFERLIEEHDVPSIMLDTQYRMHPSISAFPNAAFYKGMLQDGTVDHRGDVSARLSPPTTAFLLEKDGVRENVTFIDHDHPESPQNRSMCNFREAGLVSDIVADLLYCNPLLRGTDIGVIAPYVRQISLIDHTLNVDPKRQPAFKQLLGEERAREVRDVEVKTVDGFEGREKQVIIFSTVRSNDYGGIGFLADWRRLNVGLTRAQKALIIIGNQKTLSRARAPVRAASYPAGGAKIWKDFIKHLKERDLILSA